MGEKYLPVGGRVRKLRAVEDQSAPIPEDITSKLGGSINIARCAQGKDGLLAPSGEVEESEGPRSTRAFEDRPGYP